MASISRDQRTNSLSIFFRFAGKAFKRSLKTADEHIAPSKLQEAWNWFFRERNGADPKWAVLRGFHVLSTLR